MYCNQCGKQIDDNMSFCIFCGSPADPNASIQNDVPVRTAATQKTPKPPSNKKNPKKLLAIGIPVIAVCLAFLVLILTGVIRFGSAAVTTMAGDESGQGLTLSEAVTVAQGTVPQSGGTVTVNKGDSAINGLTIDVPSGSYADNLDFSVAEAAVQANGFGKELVIISPMIKVDNGGAYSSDMMTVKVPCNVPDGYIPMGFYYDEETKALESLPVLDAGNGYVTLGLRHFSDTFVGAVSEKDAASITSFDTGFKPGVDDFHMENNGSYIEPGGHCAGQSLATMWYYANKKLKGSSKLWNLYDNYGKDAQITFKTPDFQNDDVMALRLATVAQKEATWGSTLRDRFMSASKLSDKATFYGLVYAMKLHKSPQYVSIQRLDASGNVAGGHAIIAYRVEGNRIYVADPNYPGKTDRYIELSDGKFKPYSSAATAQDAANGKGKSYARINFVGISAMYDHPKMAQLWGELEKRTVGDAYFPDVTPKLIATVQTDEGEKEEEVIQGYEAQTEKLKLKGLSATSAVNYDIYVTDGKETVTKVPADSDKGYTVPLTLGENYIGISLFKTADGSPQWYDFKWVKVLLPFPYAGEWEGTIHIDKVNIPAPDPASSSSSDSGDSLDDVSAACDEMTVELYNQLKAMEGTEQPIKAVISPTTEKNKFTITFVDTESTDSSESSGDSMEITVSGNTAKGTNATNDGTSTLTLEPDGNTTDKIKGKFSMTSTKDPSQGIFTTLKLDRIKE